MTLLTFTTFLIKAQDYKQSRNTVIQVSVLVSNSLMDELDTYTHKTSRDKEQMNKNERKMEQMGTDKFFAELTRMLND